MRRGTTILIATMSLVLGAFLLIPCIKAGGVSLGGVDYSGHGAWGWLALYCTCAFMAGIVSMLVLWLLKKTPQRRPDWRYFIFGVVFLLCLAFGLARRCPGPIVGEMGLSAMACAAFFWSLYGKQRAGFDKNQ